VLKPAVTAVVIPALFAIYFPTCAKPIAPTGSPKQMNLAELWQDPADIASRDLFSGGWGADRAPDPKVVYHYVKRKEEGTNPGVTVVDPEKREWHVKQPPKNDQGAEGPIEVTLSRILWAVGYHQPPEYFLPQFTIVDERQVQPGETTVPPTRVEPGGRFRLEDGSIKKIGTWSWQQNPFVNAQPYQGLLVILMIFNSSDIKNDNNTRYEVHKPPKGDDADVKTWYVVRDLGTALGESGRLKPHRGNPDLFDKAGFVKGVEHGFVRFDYHGWHQDLVKDRITTGDVRWACELLSRLSDRQWADAFRAGGYEPALAQRFISRVHQKIRQGLELPASDIRVTDR
jgi:hypothetical protein